MTKLLLVVCLTLVAIAPSSISQDTNLRAQLEGIHNQWFAAFDKGDGATMDKLEANNLVLVFPDARIWKKSEPRAGKVKPTGYKSRSLTDVEVRQFGDTAVLTGLLKTVDEKSQPNVAGTTVVFVRQNGQWALASAHWSVKE